MNKKADNEINKQTDQQIDKQTDKQTYKEDDNELQRIKQVDTKARTKRIAESQEFICYYLVLDM